MQVPRAVRIAAALTALQGVGGIALAVALVVRVLQGVPSGGKILGAAGLLVLLFAGVLAAAFLLWRGKHGARSPVIVTQLLLIGCAWYAYGPSNQQLMGALAGLYCVAVLVLLFTREGRAWAMGTEAD
ncbi:membrane protein [Lentzea sp. NBRC 105346]|uniref:hypothetical protein n=1 Tax=Lentzea sp. NBRC 105346 TaxID=3032205 RepID=UPI00249FA123|nr:hypothetical protein [Lentzea sp. NBRC 105346]GLZ29878.1 membrane protein [Lentzea sp. NBRC 105346]